MKVYVLLDRMYRIYGTNKTYPVNAYLVIDARLFTVSLLMFPTTLQRETMCPHFSEGQRA